VNCVFPPVSSTPKLFRQRQSSPPACRLTRSMTPSRCSSRRTPDALQAPSASRWAIGFGPGQKFGSCSHTVASESRLLLRARRGGGGYARGSRRGQTARRRVRSGRSSPPRRRIGGNESMSSCRHRRGHELVVRFLKQEGDSRLPAGTFPTGLRRRTVPAAGGINPAMVWRESSCAEPIGSG